MYNMMIRQKLDKAARDLILCQVAVYGNIELNSLRRTDLPPEFFAAIISQGALSICPIVCVDVIDSGSQMLAGMVQLESKLHSNMLKEDVG